MRLCRFISLALLLLASALAWAEKQQAPPSIEGAVTVNAEESAKLILSPSPPVVIDARRKDEYLKGHIEGAHHILDEELDAERLAAVAPDKSTALLFYCNGIYCMRSRNAVRKSLALGYRHIYWFRGGWLEWLEKGLPVLKGDALK